MPTRNELTEEKKNKVRANIERLEYFEGQGLLKGAKKKLLANEVYLFIGAGGTGYKALRAVKELIKRTVDSAQSAGRVKYLAVDCAHNELDELVADGVFTDEEIQKIPFENAVNTINPRLITPDKKEWVAPELFDQVNGNAPGRHPGFDGDGAGAWRQPGRIRLTTPNGFSDITNKLSRVISSLSQPNTKLKIFFLCSVAGGTGSGTIIDLVYLTRHVLNTRYNALYKNTNIYGYIFSPDACEGEINQQRHPNANNYAAMKEIDYFMRLNDRSDKYVFRYGTTDVKIDKSIFDTCVIVEGRGIFSSFDDPAKAARDVASQSILSSMTTLPLAGNNQETMMDSVYSNSLMNISAATATMNPVEYPRYLGYRYNASGFASVKVPVELLTWVLANEVFKALWKRWNNADPTDNAAKDFLKSCGIGEKQVISNRLTIKEWNDLVKTKANDIVKGEGIIYMINLSKDIVNLLNGDDYIPYASRRKSARWDSTRVVLNEVKKFILQLNNGAWSVMKIILEKFKELLEAEAGVLTNVEVYGNRFNKTLYWCPINLTEAKAQLDKSRALMNHITNGIYSERDRKKIVDNFIDKLLNPASIDQLTGITSDDMAVQSKFDPAGFIRDFVDVEFSRIINKNIETFLVKFFSADPDASVTVPNPDDAGGRPLPSPGLQMAASEIYRLLTTNGMAMAALTPNDITGMVSARRFITVPQCCAHLLDLIRNYAAQDGYRVFESTSNDEFTMIEMLQGLPAFAFQSIANSESDYETTYNNWSGIHLEQCGDGIHNWVNLPNLTDPAKNRSQREADNLLAAKNDYDKAEKLGMVRTNGNINEVYCLKTTRDVGSVVDRLMDREFEDYIDNTLSKASNAPTIADCLSALETRGIIEYRALRHKGDVLTYVGGNIDLEDYPWQTMIRMFHLWHAVKATIPLVEKLMEAITKKRNQLEAQARRSTRHVIFVYALRAIDETMEPAILRYDDLTGRWLITPDVDEVELVDVSFYKTGNAIYQECKEYFAFEAFADLYDITMQSIENKINNRRTDPAIWQADMTKGKELQNSFTSLRQNKRNGDLPMASNEFENAANLIEAGLAMKIRDFYDALINSISRN